MTGLPRAKLRRGGVYQNLHPQYQGNGTVTRSCGKCGQHKANVGGRVLRIIGWICAECAAPKAKASETTGIV